jgi:hypothetical protein
MATKKPTPKSKKAREATAPTQPVLALSAEMQQLEAIRARFSQLAGRDADALFARHSDEHCRNRGLNTKAKDTFRGAMSWARTLGEHSDDPAVSPPKARWFLDCLTALGDALQGRVVAANPAHAGQLADAERAAKKLSNRALRMLREAAGSQIEANALIDAAVAANGPGHKDADRAEQLAALCKRWLSDENAPPLALCGITAATATALSDAAATLRALIQSTPAAREVDRDGPETNAAEGRLFFAMRPLWDDAAEAREDGRSKLQFTVNPAILRGLNLERRNRRDPDAT